MAHKETEVTVDQIIELNQKYLPLLGQATGSDIKFKIEDGLVKLKGAPEAWFRAMHSVDERVKRGITFDPECSQHNIVDIVVGASSILCAAEVFRLIATNPEAARAAHLVEKLGELATGSAKVGYVTIVELRSLRDAIDQAQRAA